MLVLSNQHTFQCKFCGEDFGNSVVNLALHIGRNHDDANQNN